MAPKSSKQAKRAEVKAAKKVDDEPPAPNEGDGIVSIVKQLGLCSVLVQVGPLLPQIMKSVDAETQNVEKTEEVHDTNDENVKQENDAAEASDQSQLQGAADIFASLDSRLPFYNALGLGQPASAEAAKHAWLTFKSLEVDGGPKARKKGNPGMDRIRANINANLPQYLHILLALMCLRALLFRSFFACLPWLVGYQVLSLKLPIEMIRDKFPQVPPVELRFRVAATVGIHALMWLFFLYESLYKAYLVEKILLIGFFVAHSYVVSPVVN